MEKLKAWILNIFLVQFGLYTIIHKYVPPLDILAAQKNPKKNKQQQQKNTTSPQKSHQKSPTKK